MLMTSTRMRTVAVMGSGGLVVFWYWTTSVAPPFAASLLEPASAASRANPASRATPESAPPAPLDPAPPAPLDPAEPLVVVDATVVVTERPPTPLETVVEGPPV